MKSKSSTKHVMGLVDCVEIQEYKVGLNYERIVRLLIIALVAQWGTKLLDNPQSSWLTWILDTQPQMR